MFFNSFNNWIISILENYQNSSTAAVFAMGIDLAEVWDGWALRQHSARSSNATVTNRRSESVDAVERISPNGSKLSSKWTIHRRRQHRREAQRRRSAHLDLRVPRVQSSVISLRRIARVRMPLACRSHVHQEGSGRRTRPSPLACQRRHSPTRCRQPRRRTLQASQRSFFPSFFLLFQGRPFSSSFPH